MNVDRVITAMAIAGIITCIVTIGGVVSVLLPDNVTDALVGLVFAIGSSIVVAIVVLLVYVMSGELRHRIRWRHHTKNFKLIEIDKVSSKNYRGTVSPKVYLNLATGWANRKTRQEWEAVFHELAARDFQVGGHAFGVDRFVTFPYSIKELEDNMDTVIKLVNETNHVYFIDKPRTEAALQKCADAVEKVLVDAGAN